MNRVMLSLLVLTACAGASPQLHQGRQSAPKIPALGLSFIVLANSERVWWDNPLDRAEVHRSRFAPAFLRAFVDV